MGIWDYLGLQLNEAFTAGGEKIVAAYDLGGGVIYTAEAVDRDFDGVHRVWRFRKAGGKAWQTVRIPHDWSICEDFNSASPADYEGGYLDGGEAVYETSFRVPDALRTKRTVLYFDGVYMESAVTLNGVKLGENKNGYNPFSFDVTDKLTDGVNTLRVEVVNRQPNSRWYSGSGIYRPVYLLGLEKAGFSVQGLVITSPSLETEYEGDVVTKAAFTLTHYGAAGSRAVKLVIRRNGETVGSGEKTVALQSGENALELSASVSAPELWDVGAPNLYEAAILADGTEIASAVFGYRFMKWDADTGFWLNGRNTKIKGVCLHHDLGCIGAEANRSAMERQLDSMTTMGANAIRLTHNPSSTLLLELCRDRGVLCVEEFFDCWTRAKKTYDFARFFDANAETVIETTIRRSVNNPAVMMWSLGNEINGGFGELGYTAEEAAAVCARLVAAVKRTDTTRPVTMGINYPETDKGVFAAAVNPLLDVCGVNYKSNDLSVPHALGKPSYGSETTSALSSRGVYKRDDAKLQCSSLDDDKVEWGSFAGVALYQHMTNAYSGGMFVWTGWDYIGEPTPFNKFPAKSSYFGICDLAGFPKDIYYMYQSRWTSEPMVHIMPSDWDSWTEGETVKVYLYTNCEKMELFLNGVSVGTKTKYQMDDRYRYSFDVAYAKGTLMAKGYDADGNVVATDTVKSSDGVPAKLALSSYKPTVNVTGDDLVFITCDVLDANGVFIPSADTVVTFTCEGGTVLGTDNGNAACVENMRGNVRSAFSGKCLCVCRHDGAVGEMVVRAKAEGVEGASVRVRKV